MENAVEALKTAAAVLIFGIAITIAFTMFSRAKETADAVVKSQDTQEYLEAADLDSKLYTSSSSIESGTSSTTQGENPTMTTDGYRIVGIDDVISTIYRYNLEKYGVTIIDGGTVIARFDSNTESVMRQWYNIADKTNPDNTTITSNEIKDKFAERIGKNISTKISNITLKKEDLEGLYKIKVDGNDNIKCGAPWYGNEKEIIKRINAEVGGFAYEFNKQIYNEKVPSQKNLKSKLENRKIIEVVNEIDNSQYLKDEGGKETSLLQQYELPTIEIVYICTKE